MQDVFQSRLAAEASRLQSAAITPQAPTPDADVL
jgi:hypothetical protein